MAKQQPVTAPKAVPRPKAKAKPEPTGPSFAKFLIDRAQWIDWAVIGGLSIAILIFLKIYYPYPQTETDSGKYIESALTGKINCYRPYGYSGFLNFFHGISTDVKFVLTWQWFVTFTAVTFFLFSIKFMFRSLTKPAFYILCLICVLNPSVIFMNSYIMSDSLFVNLTLLFLTTTMWIFYNGSYVAMVANILLLWWCMDTRYIGLFYPLFSAAALGWTFWKRFKWVAIVAALVPFVMLFFYRSAQTDKMKEEFGVETFSAFGGWQKANNGVSVIPYVKIDESQIQDPDVRNIQHVVSQFPDSFFKTDDIIATSFMWPAAYPGKTYLRMYLQGMRQRDPSYDYSRAWVEVGTQYDKYGEFLQSNYRWEYVKHYIVPNFKLIFKAHEIHDVMDSVSYKDVSNFFTSDRQTYYYKSHFFLSLTGIRQLSDSLFWVLFIGSALAGLFMINKLGWSLEQKLVAATLVLFVPAFGAVSTVAAPINNFRYIMPIVYSQLTVPVLIISAIVSYLRNKNLNTINGTRINMDFTDKYPANA